MIKVAIAGARGRMGTAAVAAITNAPDMELVGALDYKYEGQFLHNETIIEGPEGVQIFTSFDTLIEEKAPDVLLDLTSPEAVYKNMHQAISNKVRPVVGTSGLTMDQIQELEILANKNETGTIIAPNFSVGAVLMMKFSAMAAKYLTDIEIIELHHNRKLDAPSGTAMKTVEMIKEVREPKIQGHPEEIEQLQGARGADIDGMKVHSVRLPGLLAHQEVLLGGTGELLTIKHDSFDRNCFMPGVLLAIRHSMKHNAFIYGLEHIID